MQVLVAPNTFKNALAADTVADAICKGLAAGNLRCNAIAFPVGDGGDGTANLLTQHFNGKKISVKVHDPLNRIIHSSFGLIDNGKTAVIEMADASGLRLLQPHEYDPLRATSYGTGELIRAALDNNVTKIIIGVGGSATVDGGIGIMQALGALFVDAQGKKINAVPANLTTIRRIDTTAIDARLKRVEIVILCDVKNVLLGEHGAAAVFAPQKGANEETVQQLEMALTHLRDLVLEDCGVDINSIIHGGAAGGVAAMFAHFMQATLVNGIDYFLNLTGFETYLQNSDIVITGEGSIDMQTLDGKAPYGVAIKAKQYHKKVIAFSGKIPLQPNAKLDAVFDILLPISNEITTLEKALAETYDNLYRTAKMLSDLLALQQA